MAWNYDYSDAFLSAYKAFPRRRRIAIYNRVREIKQAPCPLSKATARKGKHAYFSFLARGNALVAKVDDVQLYMEFFKIQVQ